VQFILSSIRVAGWSTACCASACNTDTTQTQPHQISNTQRHKNKTTNVVIQQHSRKLLMMDILMSETSWVHKKWNKIASNIKLVFYSSAITMMHGPINMRFLPSFWSSLNFSGTISADIFPCLNLLLNCLNILLKYPLFCQIVMKFWIFLADFKKNTRTSNFVKIRPFGADFHVVGWTDRRD